MRYIAMLCLAALSSTGCNDESAVRRKEERKEKCSRICPDGKVEGKFETDQYVRDKLLWYCVCKNDNKKVYYELY